MLLLSIGLIIFLGMHSSRIVAEEKRTAFIARRSENAWKALYSIVSMAGLLLVIYGYGQTRANPVMVWNPPAATAHAAALLTWLAFILLAASKGPANHLRSRIGHPMVLGVKIWAAAHLLANGRLGDMLLFGAFLVWAVLDFIASRRRDRLMASNGQGNATTAAPTLKGDIAAVAVGTIAWLVFALWLHRWLIGVSPFA